MRRLAFSLVLLAVACGPTQAHAPSSPSAAAVTASATAPAAPNPSASPSPLPQPSTSASLVFAAPKAEGTTDLIRFNTVAIAGLDGYARAKATFVPMSVPKLGCTRAILPVSAHVAAGHVYFADGTGVVRSLSVQGQVTKVATFPLSSSQQMLSFAVSPDGSRLLATLFTLPAKPQLGCAGTRAVGGLSLDVYSAQPGAASTLVHHESLPAVDPQRPELTKVMALVGWDQVGPIATYPTCWARGCWNLPHNYNGTPVRVESTTGKLLKQVSLGACEVQDTALSGDFLCPVDGDKQTLSVRRPDGSEIWRATAEAGRWTLLVSFLSPDELLVLAPVGGSSAEVAGKDGSRVRLADDFWPTGWLDSTTAIGVTGSGLSYVSLTAPLTKVDIGFDGYFIGTVHA